MSSIVNGNHTLAAASNVFSPGNTLKQQVRSRMAALSKTIDPEGVTGVKLHANGTYEITAESKSEDAERVKAEIATTLANDETLKALIQEFKSQYKTAIESNKKHMHFPVGADNESGDTAEISDQARALLEQSAVGQTYQFTMKVDMDIIEANEPPVSLANRYFFSARDALQKAAEGTGEFENDYIIKFDENNELYIDEVTGRSGAVRNEKTTAETSRIESFLQSLNQAIKSEAAETDSELVKTLRRFLDVASRADASPPTNVPPTQAYYKLPFTIWGTTTRG